MARHAIQMTPEMLADGALAAALWHARKDRSAHPVGSFDEAGRWYPSEDENSDEYTFGVRSPSRSFPNSYNLAARSRQHVVALTRGNRAFVAGLVTSGNLLERIGEKEKKLGAGWLLKAAREAHDTAEAERLYHEAEGSLGDARR